jgi:hypothetical protein
MTFHYIRYSCHFLGNVPNHSQDNSVSQFRVPESKIQGYGSAERRIAPADRDRFLQKKKKYLSPVNVVCCWHFVVPYLSAADRSIH